MDRLPRSLKADKCFVELSMKSMIYVRTFSGGIQLLGVLVPRPVLGFLADVACDQLQVCGLRGWYTKAYGNALSCGSVL